MVRAMGGMSPGYSGRPRSDGNDRRECLTVLGARRTGAYPAGQTLGQTASFRQTAPETWCQSRVCGVSRPTSPKTVKHRSGREQEMCHGQAGGLSYRAPAAGDGGAAGRADPRRVQLVADDAEAAALDEEAAALRASRVLEVAHLARQVAGIDIVQASLAADVGGADEGGWRRGGRPLHTVRRAECGHVPGNVAGDTGEVAGDAPEFLIR